MTDDIVKLAALRQQRRPKTGRSGETTLLIQGDSTPSENNDITAPQENLTVDSPRSRGTRQRLNSDSEFDDVISSHENKFPLPFVSCKVSDVNVKALISSSSKSSLISREAYSRVRSSPVSDSHLAATRADLTLGGRHVCVTLEIQDNIPDVVLGVDFLINYRCGLNFKDRSLYIGRDADVTLPFLPEADIPLKFRVHRSVAASF